MSATFSSSAVSHAASRITQCRWNSRTVTSQAVISSSKSVISVKCFTGVASGVPVAGSAPLFIATSSVLGKLRKLIPVQR